MTVVFYSKDGPKVHAIFIAKAIVMSCISTNYKADFVMVEEPVGCQEDSQACWNVTIHRNNQRKTFREEMAE